MIPYCFIEQALWFSGSTGFYRGAVNSTLLTQTAWEKKKKKLDDEPQRRQMLNLEEVVSQGAF